jgi:hypothetical protein
MTPLGIDPSTFRVVAQSLNQLRRSVPPYKFKTSLNFILDFKSFVYMPEVGQYGRNM